MKPPSLNVTLVNEFGTLFGLQKISTGKIASRNAAYILYDKNYKITGKVLFNAVSMREKTF